MLALALAGLLSAPAAAHAYPMKPVRVFLRAEGAGLLADITADSVYWHEEILPGLAKPGPLPPAAEKAAQDYVNARLSLLSGGAVLKGRLLSGRWLQRPWEFLEKGRVELRLLYSLPAAPEIAVRASFYDEYYKERPDLGPGLPVELSWPGGKASLAPGAEARLRLSALPLSALQKAALATRRAADLLLEAGLPLLLVGAGLRSLVRSPAPPRPWAVAAVIFGLAVLSPWLRRLAPSLR